MQNKQAFATIVILTAAVFSAMLAINLTVQPASAFSFICSRVLACAGVVPGGTTVGTHPGSNAFNAFGPPGSNTAGTHPGIAAAGSQPSYPELSACGVKPGVSLHGHTTCAG
jgi:hypothetical protein